MESRTDANTCNVNIGNSRQHFTRKILKPNRNLFVKPVYVKRTEAGDVINPQTQFMNYMNSIFPKDKQDSVKDSCTQTSKTIIELAKLDGRGAISPDSLNGSPRHILPNTYESEIQNLNQTTSLHFKNLHHQPNLYTYNSNYANIIPRNDFQSPNQQNEIFKLDHNLREYNENIISQRRNETVAEALSIDNVGKNILTETDIFANDILKKQIQSTSCVKKLHKQKNKYCLFNDSECSTITEESLNINESLSKLNDIEEEMVNKNNTCREYILDNLHNQSMRSQNKMNQNDIYVKYMDDKKCAIKKEYEELHSSPIIINVTDKPQKSTQNFRKTTMIDQFLTKTQNRKKTGPPGKITPINNYRYGYRQETKNSLMSRSYVEPKGTAYCKEFSYPGMPNSSNDRRDMYLKSDKEEHSYSQPIYQKQVPKLDLHVTSDTNLSEIKLNSPNPSYLGRRSNSFMSPTLASARKSLFQDVQAIRNLMGTTRRGRSFSPKYRIQDVNVPREPDIPYIDQVEEFDIDTSQLIEDVKEEEYRSNSNLIVQASVSSLQASVSSADNQMYLMLTRMKSSDWNTSLKGLAELTEFSRSVPDPDILVPYMTLVNQKLLHLLRSPRSHVCRTACQVAGHLFETMKDTRRPEFDDIVSVLLHKTADANKFIRQDANLSLDCMVTHIPTFHAIRSLSAKGPVHKNSLVRTATIRLLICAVVIAGPKELLGTASNDNTRKRVIQCLVLFLQDKNVDTRRYAERMYKILHKEDNFENCLRKYLYKEELEVFKNRTIKLLKRTLK